MQHCGNNRCEAIRDVKPHTCEAIVMYCMFVKIGCTYTGFKCYCVSRWLAWCSHGDCDVLLQIVVYFTFFGSRVFSVVPHVCRGPRVPVL